MAGNKIFSKYVRPMDDALAVSDNLPPKYRAQTLSDDPTAFFLGITLEEGGCGPTLHYHQCDQLYFLTRSTIKIKFYDTVHDVRPGSLIFIPAGVPHMNWNTGQETEAHLEMQFPSPHRFKQVGYLVDTPKDVPAEWQTSVKPYIRHVADYKPTELRPGTNIVPLADPSSGSKYAQIYHMEVHPQKNDKASFHIHEFDQYYFVLEGEVTVEAALQKASVAEKETLVVLPSGVPYRLSYGGQSAVKQLAISVPPPTEGKPRGVGVEFKANGEEHGGGLPNVSDIDS